MNLSNKKSKKVETKIKTDSICKNYTLSLVDDGKFLNMIVLPALYLKYGREREKAAVRGYHSESSLSPVGDQN